MPQIFSFFDKSFFTYESSQKIWDGMYNYYNCRPLFPGLKRRASFFPEIETEITYFNESEGAYCIEMYFPGSSLKSFQWYNLPYLKTKFKRLNEFICLGRVIEDIDNRLGVITEINMHGGYFTLSFVNGNERVSFKDFVKFSDHTVFKHICPDITKLDFDRIYNECFHVVKFQSGNTYRDVNFLLDNNEIYNSVLI